MSDGAKSMELASSISSALSAKFPGVPISDKVEATFIALAIHMDLPADVNRLTGKEQRKVLRRLAFKGGQDPCRSEVVDLCLQGMQALNGKRLRALHMIKSADIAKADGKKLRIRRRQARRELQREERTLIRSLTDPVSRIAGEAEHLVVLAGLAEPAFYRTREWRRVRYEALLKAGSRCRGCGAGPADGARLLARHIVSRLVAPDRAFDLYNIRITCTGCDAGALPPAG